MRLYIAGPLFTPYQRQQHEANVKKLEEAGHECFLPQSKEHNARNSSSVPAEVFQVDLSGVLWAEAVVALLDGPDVSSGTACEIGIFYEEALHDPTKKGILGILMDERPYHRQACQVGELINFFTGGSIEKTGAIYRNVDDVIEHLAQWEQE
jgi:nucleoside 2-deoxyribosyltransferase